MTRNGNTLVEYSKQLGRYNDNIVSINSNLRTKIACNEQIGKRLKQISETMIGLQGNCQNVGEKLILISSLYTNTEAAILDFSTNDEDVKNMESLEF